MHVETRQLIRKLRKQGFDVRPGKRGSHYRVSRGSSPFVVVSSTPSDRRAIKNAVSTLKRIGYVP